MKTNGGPQKPVEHNIPLCKAGKLSREPISEIGGFPNHMGYLEGPAIGGLHARQDPMG